MVCGGVLIILSGTGSTVNSQWVRWRVYAIVHCVPLCDCPANSFDSVAAM